MFFVAKQCIYILLMYKMKWWLDNYEKKYEQNIAVDSEIRSNIFLM